MPERGRLRRLRRESRRGGCSTGSASWCEHPESLRAGEQLVVLGFAARGRSARAAARIDGRAARLALHLEHGGERGDRGGAALRLGGEARHARRVAVAAVALVAHHLAVPQLDHAPLHLVDEAGLVRRHDDRGAAGVDAGEQLHDVDGCRGVEVSGRLVGQQHLRTVHERPGDRDALLLTAGELVREPLLLAGEADEREHLGHGLLDESARRSDDLEREGDVLEDGLRRQQPEVLEHRADVPAEVRHLAVGQRAQVAAEHDDASVARRLFAEDQAQARRLARARGADEEDELAAEHLEVHIAQGGLRRAAIALRDVLEPDHGHTSLCGQAPCGPNDTRGRASGVRRAPARPSPASSPARRSCPTGTTGGAVKSHSLTFNSGYGSINTTTQV